LRKFPDVEGDNALTNIECKWGLFFFYVLFRSIFMETKLNVLLPGYFNSDFKKYLLALSKLFFDEI
jgi:hypothetical protein